MNKQAIHFLAVPVVRPRQEMLALPAIAWKLQKKDSFQPVSFKADLNYGSTWPGVTLLPIVHVGETLQNVTM